MILQIDTNNSSDAVPVLLIDGTLVALDAAYSLHDAYSESEYTEVFNAAMQYINENGGTDGELVWVSESAIIQTMNEE